LDAEVNDEEDLRGEEVVLTGEVNVGGDVRLHVLLELFQLGNFKAKGTEDDGEDMDAVVEVVFKFVDGGWNVNFLFCEAADVIAVDAASAI
jgi:hypothetical protein